MIETDIMAFLVTSEAGNKERVSGGIVRTPLFFQYAPDRLLLQSETLPLVAHSLIYHCRWSVKKLEEAISIIYSTDCNLL